LTGLEFCAKSRPHFGGHIGLRLDGLISWASQGCIGDFSSETIIVRRMDWFFAINESSAAFGMYTGLAKVAVHTALTHMSLRPRMLYDGCENAFTSWMRSRGVDIIFAESYLKNDLPKLSG
jgi:hypothetical protein